MMFRWRELLVLIATLCLVYALPQTTTTRTTPPMKETIKQLTDQLMALNATSHMNFDTRTPPRVKQQMKLVSESMQSKAVENSHAGIAVPINDEELILEEATKKMNYYKQDKQSTTDSGISTWILLSGQNLVTSTPKSVTAPKPVVIIKEEEVKDAKKNSTVIVSPKPIKPIFKRRPMITKRPVIQNTDKVITTLKPVLTTIQEKKLPITTSPPPIAAKLTKTKAASVNNNAANNRNATKKIIATSTKQRIASSTDKKKKEPTEFVKVPIKSSNDTSVQNITSIESNLIGPESKDGSIELSTQASSKKTRRPTNKKKKNKNKKKNKIQVAEDKIDTVSSNNTKVSTKIKEKPFSTQIYNYLSREVMPTVGVGLVGLMVTAGLASYFLYPFGALRRSYDVDRKDKEGIYYKDPYGGGVAEEEMIGKVIAGMPSHSKTSTKNSNNGQAINYNRIQGSRNTYPTSVRYRQVESKYTQPLGTVENVELVHDTYPSSNYNAAEMAYNQNIPTNGPPVEYVTEKQFVVGNIPKELEEPVTPVAVPEHGPRRRRRQVDDIENEIDYNITKESSDGSTVVTTNTENIATSTSTEYNYETSTMKAVIQSNNNNQTTVYEVADKVESIFNLLKDLFYYKLKLGLEMIQNKTASMSRYISRMQERIDKTYREGYD